MESLSHIVGRGGLKLQAAIERFQLAEAIREASAVDVGASTGGFTEQLLNHGASRVTAVDVGHGQLHERLRGDPRVESLEGIDWKRLSLDRVPGPFDFFTVDVSFVAARNMLRGLAFRLRDGAQGVVLVKPQFELPDASVRGGDVSDPNLRKRALDRFRGKAEALGFQVVATIDSPVAGGSGTVEMLAHLVFRGRPASLPLPGEHRGQTATVAKRKPSAGDTGLLRWFVVVAPGLEQPALAEVRRLPGAGQISAVDGGIELEGDLELGFQANLRLRIATKVLARVGECQAREFERLRHRLAALPWERFVPPGSPLEVSAAPARCRLYHKRALADTVALAVADRVKGAKVDDTLPPVRILLRGENDRWTASVDSSGELLHRRGWRQDAAHAPLRETLAAGLLALADWDPSTPFVDPMCGSGTLAIEACQVAMRMVPGLHRGFALERWPGVDTGRLAELRTQAAAEALPAPPAPIRASDRDARAVQAARANAARAGVAEHIDIAEADLADARPDGAPGLLLVNPPYGHRIGNEGRAISPLYRRLGRALAGPFASWRAGVLLADVRLASALGRKPSSSHRLTNGGLKVTLLVFEPSFSAPDASD